VTLAAKKEKIERENESKSHSPFSELARWFTERGYASNSSAAD
jgi:hypothetical protein